MGISVNRIRAGLGLSNIHLSDKFSKAQRKELFNSDLFRILDKKASKKGIDVSISPLNKYGSDNAVGIKFTRNTYEHITDVIANGDMKFIKDESVYVPVTKQLGSVSAATTDNCLGKAAQIMDLMV